MRVGAILTSDSLVSLTQNMPPPAGCQRFFY